MENNFAFKPAITFGDFSTNEDNIRTGLAVSDISLSGESVAEMILAATLRMNPAVQFQMEQRSAAGDSVSCCESSPIEETAIVPTEKQIPIIANPDVFYPNRGFQFTGKSGLVAKAEEFRDMSLNSDEKLVGQIVEKLMLDCTIRNYRGRLYVFNVELGIYYDMERDFDFLVNTIWGGKILHKGSSRTYAEVKSLLKKEASLLINDNLAESPSYWAFKNGILSIHDGGFFQNDGSMFITGAFACDYDPVAKCPRFDQFIASVCCGNELLMRRLWEVIGVIFASDKKAKSFYLFYGPKDTGKSLLANLLVDIIGADRVSHLAAADFGEQYEAADLCEKVLNTSMDLPDEPLDGKTVAKIKSYTGDDPVHSQRKYKVSVDFMPTAVLLFGSNSMIRTKTRDAAFDDRLVAVPFNNPVPKDQQNKMLREELFAEASGIVLKAAKIYRDLVLRNYAFTEIELPQEESIDMSTVVGLFITESIQFTGNEGDVVATEDLHAAYRDFCLSRNLPMLEVDRFSSVLGLAVKGRATKCRKRLNGSTNPVSAYKNIRLA